MDDLQRFTTRFRPTESAVGPHGSSQPQTPAQRPGHVLMAATPAQALFGALPCKPVGTELALPSSIYTLQFPAHPLPAHQQDGYMMGELTRYIRTEYAGIHHENCRRNTIAERFNYDKILSEQHCSTDGDTAALGGGYFLTVAGEAYYRYRCRRLVVANRLLSRVFLTF